MKDSFELMVIEDNSSNTSLQLGFVGNVVN